MSKEALEWCEKRGELISLSAIPKVIHKISPELKRSWEKRFGSNFWIHRSIWLLKPAVLLQSPFQQGLWLDLDCEIKGSVKPLFDSLSNGVDLALARDSVQDLDFLFPDEVLYNGGVIAFRRKAKILIQWQMATVQLKDPMPTDQEYLSRMIYLHQPQFTELLPIYNWSRIWGVNSESLIHHYCGGSGKIEILKKIGVDAFSQSSAPEFWKRIAKEVSTFLERDAKI